jgi:23S rRNA pseudouridine1911/1915/1917 synthase
MRLDVLYLDNHLLVVCKNQGMLAQKDKTGDIDLLTLGKEFVKNKFHKPGKAYLGLVHRLDRPVSGIMVLARTSKAASRLSDQFRNNTPEKHYIALVEGSCFGQGTCIDYLLKGSSGTHVVNKMHPGALYAELTWRSVASKKNISLLKVVLKTGRPHQIRIQLSHMGFPVLGDFRYGAKKQFDGRNMALHCCLLGIEASG